jgi:hypothetical protein
MCIPQLLDRIFNRGLLSPFDVWSGLLIFFCPDDLSIEESGVLKSHTITVSGSICLFMSSSVFMKMRGPTLGAHIFTIISCSWLIVPFIIWYTWYEYSWSCLLSDFLCLECHILSFHFQSVYFVGKVTNCFLQTGNSWILFVNPVNQSVSFNWIFKTVFHLEWLLNSVC